MMNDEAMTGLRQGNGVSGE